MEKFIKMYRVHYEELVGDVIYERSPIYTTLEIPEVHKYLERRFTEGAGKVNILNYDYMDLLVDEGYEIRTVELPKEEKCVCSELKANNVCCKIVNHEYLNGEIEDTVLSDKLLSKEEISDLYKGTKLNTEPNKPIKKLDLNRVAESLDDVMIVAEKVNELINFLVKPVKKHKKPETKYVVYFYHSKYMEKELGLGTCDFCQKIDVEGSIGEVKQHNVFCLICDDCVRGLNKILEDNT